MSIKQKVALYTPFFLIIYIISYINKNVKQFELKTIIISYKKKKEGKSMITINANVLGFNIENYKINKTM